MKPLVQISLDLTEVAEALDTAEMALRAGVDWLEVGTPLILAEGMEGVRRLCERHPDTPIVADLKTMDGGWLEAEIMAKAGATHVVVMGRAHRETIEQFGRIDGLVNNAALTTRATLDTTTPETLDRILTVNLKTPLFLIQKAMPYFREQGGGVVLNIGSINALGGERALLPYSVAKDGLMTMTRNLADAHASEHVRFNQLNVGWTLTEGEKQAKKEDGLPPDRETKLPERYAPSGRIFRPEEIAAHAAFWLSDEAGPVSGSVYEIEQFPMVGRNPEKEIGADSSSASASE